MPANVLQTIPSPTNPLLPPPSLHDGNSLAPIDDLSAQKRPESSGTIVAESREVS